MGLKKRIQEIMKLNKSLTFKEAKKIVKFQEREIRKRIKSTKNLLIKLKRKGKLTRAFEKDVIREIKTLRKKVR